MRAQHGEHRVRFGNYEARKRDSGRSSLRDPYRVIVMLKWSQFVLALLAIELLLNLVFALLYLIRPGAVANAHPGSLADAFFFSIENVGHSWLRGDVFLLISMVMSLPPSRSSSGSL